jgi:hypothetical protein
LLSSVAYLFAFILLTLIVRNMEHL